MPLFVIYFIGIPEQFWNCAEVTILPPPTPRETWDLIKNQNSPGEEKKTIIGYYASWQWYDRQKLAKPSNMDFTKVTRVYVPRDVAYLFALSNLDFQLLTPSGLHFAGCAQLHTTCSCIHIMF